VSRLDDSAGDPGLKKLLHTADDEEHNPPKQLFEAQSCLRHAQKAMSRRFESRKTNWLVCVLAGASLGIAFAPLREQPYSNRLKKAIEQVAKIHTKVENRRDNAQTKIASIIKTKYRRFAIEEHGVEFMLRNKRQAKLAADRSIAKMKHRLESALRSRLVRTPNQRKGIGGNSQTCVCNMYVPKSLGNREHKCLNCGIWVDRDHAAANVNQLIAFGTVSPTLYGASGRGSTSVEESKTRVAKATLSSSGNHLVTSEAPLKRIPQAPKSERNTAGGKPTAEGKTFEMSVHRSLPAPLAEPLANEPKSEPVHHALRMHPNSLG
jgi:hypothetical protein